MVCSRIPKQSLSLFCGRGGGLDKGVGLKEGSDFRELPLGTLSGGPIWDLVAAPHQGILEG